MSFAIETGHTLQEWTTKFVHLDDDLELWDFPYEELFNGAIEPTNDMVYWLIEGRLYETNE